MFEFFFANDKQSMVVVAVGLYHSVPLIHKDLKINVYHLEDYLDYRNQVKFLLENDVLDELLKHVDYQNHVDNGEIHQDYY